MKSEIIRAIVESEDVSLRHLAELAGGDPRYFYRGCDFAGADLRGEDLRGFNLSGASFEKAIVDRTTRVDEPFMHLIPQVPENEKPDTLSGRVRIFISYAHDDKILFEELYTHLKIMEHAGSAEIWTYDKIKPGSVWDQELMRALGSSDLILLLISPAFLASEFCFSVEMTPALARHEARHAIVIPIMLRPCDWKGAPFAHLQGLPKGLEPLSAIPKSKRAAVYAEIATAIHEVVEDIAARKRREAESANRYRLLSHEERLTALRDRITETLEQSSEAIRALDTAAHARDLAPTVSGWDTQARTDWLMGLPFVDAVDMLRGAVHWLERNRLREGAAALRTVARHLIPMLFVASQDMTDVRKLWENGGNGAIVALPAGHESFAEIVAAGLDLRATSFESPLDDSGDWPRGSWAVGSHLPSGLSGDFERTVRNDLWNRLKPPSFPGNPTSARQDAAINTRLRFFAEKRGIRCYAICNDAPEKYRVAFDKYPDVVRVVLDPGLYETHADIFKYLREILP